MGNIKLAAFDLGGVLFEWQTALYEIHKLSKIGNNDIHKFLISNLKYLEKDRMDPIQFWNKFNLEFQLKLDPQELNNSWIRGFKKYDNVWSYAKFLKKNGIKLAICSNTWPNLIYTLKEIHSDFEIFDYIFDSSQIGFVKPEREYFKFVEDRTGYKGQEILLIDDSPENLKGAENFGWKILSEKDLNKIINK